MDETLVVRARNVVIADPKTLRIIEHERVRTGEATMTAAARALIERGASLPSPPEAHIHVPAEADTAATSQ